MRSLFRALSGAIAATILVCSANIARAEWIAGKFMSEGETIEERHCVPAAPGAHPAIVLLHGASPHKGDGYGEFEKMCTELAADGYYTEFIEYFSETGAVGPERPIEMMHDFPLWLAEIRSGIDAIGKNPAIDPKRVAMMGFSLGGYLSLSAGVTDPARIAAVIDYYGGLPEDFAPQVSMMPPTLIIHGAKDQIVPVSEARALDAMLTRSGRPHQLCIYPDANHAFNFPGLPFWYNAVDAHDAWSKTLNFLGDYLKPAK